MTVGVQVLRYRDEPAAPVCDGANVSPSIAHVLPRTGATCASPAHSNGVNEIEHPTLAHRDVLTKFHESRATPYWSVVKASGLVKPFPGAFFGPAEHHADLAQQGGPKWPRWKWGPLDQRKQIAAIWTPNRCKIAPGKILTKPEALLTNVEHLLHATTWQDTLQRKLSHITATRLQTTTQAMHTAKLAPIMSECCDVTRDENNLRGCHTSLQQGCKQPHKSCEEQSLHRECENVVM